MDYVQQAIDRVRRADEQALRAQVAYKKGPESFLDYMTAERDAAVERMEEEADDREAHPELAGSTEGDGGPDS